MRRLALIFAFLALPVMAIAQTPYTVVIDLSSKTVEATNRIAIRETVPVRLVNTDIHAATNLVLRITADTQTMAVATTFTNESPGVAGGNVDLNTQEFVDYFDGASPQARRVFTLAVWDTALNRLLVNAQIQVENNPYHEGMPGPSPIGVNYLPGQWSGTNWIVGGVYQADTTPGSFVLRLMGDLHASATDVAWGTISGNIHLQSDLAAWLSGIESNVAAAYTDAVLAAQSAQSIATSAQATASSVEDIAVAVSNLAAAAYAQIGRAHV